MDYVSLPSVPRLKAALLLLTPLASWYRDTSPPVAISRGLPWLFAKQFLRGCEEALQTIVSPQRAIRFPFGQHLLFTLQRSL